MGSEQVGQMSRGMCAVQPGHLTGCDNNTLNTFYKIRAIGGDSTLNLATKTTNHCSKERVSA